MYSIQENIDYEFGIKLPKMITNYHNKQTKYYLNLNYNKFYKKRKTFNLMNYTTYKPILNYSYNNEENEINKGNNKLSLQRSLVTSCTNTTITTTTTTTANTTYNNNSNHNNNNTNSTFYKRSDYGRFKRSKDCGPSLSDVPMNVDFNTLNPSCTSNRYHIFNFEQVKYLDEIMNSFISISPKPLYQNFLGTNNIISTSSSSSSSLTTTSLPTIISKPCSCFCTIDPIIYDFMKQTYTKHSDHLSSDCLINSTNFNNTENRYNIDKVISSSVPTTVPVSKGNNLVTSIPDVSSNSEINNTSNDNNINNAYQHLTNDSCLPNHHNTISHSPIPFTLQQPLKLPTIRTQLKKLIRTIRDGLLKESIPVKEIRLNGEVASSIIIGSENKQTFHDIELLFYVDLSNSTTCTKIKSVIYSCIENILKDTIILENLSNITNHCIFCYHSTLPLNISTIQTTQNPSSSSLSYKCKYCSYYKLNPFNIPVHLNKENVENLNQQKINKNQLTNFYFPINQSFIHRQPLHENQFNTISYNNNNIIKENPSKYSMLNNKQTINNNNNNDYYKLNHSLCHYHSLLSSIECPKCSTCSRLLNPFNQHSNINYNNNNKSNNNNIHIIINNLIKFYDLKKNKKNKKIKKINKNYYPIIVIKSVACSYIEALKHLNNNIIVIYKPEEIYGGGLLKYCKLLINGYKPCKMIDIKLMEKYMCSRFFIDFSNILSQYYQLNDFLMNYVENNYKIKIDYLNVSLLIYLNI
uniref:polynucleotide adenylyltransferase n=1 Tax=Schistosoma haematobium TaxID=6185 RepID=A0A094ZWZ9_SCHHA